MYCCVVLCAQADGNREQMTILHNGRPVKTMPISMGKGSTPTRTQVSTSSPTGSGPTT
jgi:hypothetical protein